MLSSVLQSIRTTLQDPIEVTMNFVLSFPTLIQQGNLEQCPYIRALASQPDEDQDVGGIVLDVLAKEYPLRVKWWDPFTVSFIDLELESPWSEEEFTAISR